MDPEEAAQNRERVVNYLQDPSMTLALQLLDDNPWICVDRGVDLAAWSRPILDAHGLPDATLRIVGSAAVGFSLNPEHPGRLFRKLGSKEKPSDLDLALVDNNLFLSCWDEIVGSERLGFFLTDAERRNVYWGRIDDYRVPKRTTPRSLIRQLLDSVRRSPEFRGYPANVRVYRRKEDLNHKVLSDFRSLSRSMAT